MFSSKIALSGLRYVSNPNPAPERTALLLEARMDFQEAITKGKLREISVQQQSGHRNQMLIWAAFLGVMKEEKRLAT